MSSTNIARSKLGFVVRQRLAPFGELRFNRDEHGWRVILEPACVISEADGLKQHYPISWPPPEAMRLTVPFRSADNGGLYGGAVEAETLYSKQYVQEVEEDIYVPYIAVYDHGGRWKAHPPSKRKRMASWRRATDSEKLRYAPLAGMSKVPWWARHPDAGGRLNIGRVLVCRRVFVFAEKSAEKLRDEQLERFSDEWGGRVTKALRLAPCTDMHALSCPNCGECSCVDPSDIYDPGCPLHDKDSPHAGDECPF